MKVNGMASLTIVDDPKLTKDSPMGKAFLQIKFEDGQTVNMTLTLAEMIGGAGKGAQLRFGYVKEN